MNVLEPTEVRGTQLNWPLHAKRVRQTKATVCWLTESFSAAIHRDVPARSKRGGDSQSARPRR
jgi:hypothetical protein